MSHNNIMYFSPFYAQNIREKPNLEAHLSADTNIQEVYDHSLLVGHLDRRALLYTLLLKPVIDALNYSI